MILRVVTGARLIGFKVIYCGMNHMKPVYDKQNELVDLYDKCEHFILLSVASLTSGMLLCFLMSSFSFRILRWPRSRCYSL